MKSKQPFADVQLSTRMVSRLQRVDQSTADLFYSLIPRLANYCQRHYSTNKPDYRFFKFYVFCALVPMIESPVVRLELRSDKVPINSKILRLKEFDMQTSGRPGTKWVHFDVHNTIPEIDEASRLVAHVSAENQELAPLASQTRPG